MTLKMQAPAASGPLKGIRILDLTSVVLGPVATQVLGDFGADVIKVESIDGDLMRANGVSRHQGMSSIFLAINRNKRSIAIDLKTEEGRAIVLDLAEHSDVFVHNMRVPAVERLQLGYEVLKGRRPDIVYCAATGFGQDGPDKNRPAFDDIIQAACGIAGLMWQSTGAADYVPTLMADKTTGLVVVNAVLAALFHRERTGKGQYVEVPMFETMVEFTMMEHMGGLAFDPPIAPAGYGRVVNGGRKPAPTSDGWVAMMPYSPQQWISLFRRVGRQDLISAYDLSNRHKVNAAVRDLYRELHGLTPTRTTAEWIGICNELDIPASRIWRVDDLAKHPHLEAVGLFLSMQHPSEGAIRTTRPATLFGATPAKISSCAPLLGQHSHEVLRELGYAEHRIDRLCRDGIIKGVSARARDSVMPIIR